MISGAVVYEGAAGRSRGGGHRCRPCPARATSLRVQMYRLPARRRPPPARSPPAATASGRSRVLRGDPNPGAVDADTAAANGGPLGQRPPGWATPRSSVERHRRVPLRRTASARGRRRRRTASASADAAAHKGHAAGGTGRPSSCTPDPRTAAPGRTSRSHDQAAPCDQQERQQQRRGCGCEPWRPPPADRADRSQLIRSSQWNRSSRSIRRADGANRSDRPDRCQ